MSRCGECKLGCNEQGMLYCEENLGYEQCIDRLQDAIYEMSAEPIWTLCKDRMPEETGTYLVRGKWESGRMEIGECDYDTEDGYFDAAWTFNVEAWQPLPES